MNITATLFTASLPRAIRRLTGLRYFAGLLLGLLVALPALAQPTISSFAPTSGAAGSTVTITGSGFTGATSVRFGELSAVFTVNSATQLTAVVPRAASTQRINVTTSAGFNFSASAFTVTRSSSVSYAQVSSSFAGVSGGTNSAPTVADLDGDGRLDLLVGLGDGTISRYEQNTVNGTAFTALGSLRDAGNTVIDMGTQATVAIVDLEGNGRYNLVLGRGDGTVSEYEQTSVGAGTFDLVQNNLSGISTPSNTVTNMTDLDGDGRLELLVGKGDGITSHSQQSFSNTDGFYRIDTNFNLLQLSGNAAPFCVDLDGDGLLDILFGTNTGGVFRYEQASAGSFTVSQVSGSSFNALAVGTNAKPCVTDIDGDGLLDLLIGCGNGTIYRYEQSGTVPAPTITSFSPSSGPVGTTVTVSGTNLGSVTAATVNGTAGTLTGTPTATTFTFTVGAGSSTGTIGVTTAGGTVSSGGSFTVTGVTVPATVTTATPVTVTSNSAVLGGNVTSGGGGTVTERGVVYVASSGTPTTSNTKVMIGSGMGTFSQTVSSLTGNTLYSVRAYAINGAGTSYGNTQTFTTLNNPPVAGDDSYMVNEDTSPVTFSNVLANDSDPDPGTTLIITGVTQPANGTVTFTSASVTFTPAAGFTGVTSFTYTISDGNGGSDTGTVTVTVVPVNDAPVLTTSGGNTSFTAGGSAVAVDGFLTISDVDNTTLASGTVSITSGLTSSQDALAFSNTSSTSFGNIVGSYAAGTGVLSLSSAGATATVAQWQAALRAVTYNNTGTPPTGSSRAVSFRVNDGGLNSNVATKTIGLTTPAPVLTSLSPSSGPVGVSVVIAGSNFTGATAVRFNGTAASSYVVNSSTQITAVVAPGTTSGPATVITPYGTSNGLIFSITSASTSTTVVSSANPSISGQSVTFTATVANTNGSATPTGTVSFRDGGAILGSGALSGGVATFTTSTLSVGNHSITAIYLGSSGFGASTAPTLTQVVNAPPLPALTGLSPTSGPVGTSVTITGTDLDGASSVSFNGVVQTAIGNNTATGLTVNVPAGASTGDVEVTTAAGTSNALTFTVTPPAPVVTSVTGPPNGTYRIGQFVTFLVSFDQPVTVSTTGGTPIILMTVGSTPRGVTYFSGSTTSTLTFRYLVQAGDLDINGVTLGSSITANNGTLRNATGTNAVLTLNNVAVLTSVLVDGVAPTATVSTTAPSPTSNSVIPVTITFSEAVTGLTAAGLTVTNGIPGVLNGSGTTYTLNVTASAGGAVTVRANAGAAQDLAGNPSAASNTLSVTYTPPPVAISSFTPTSGAAGTVVVITGNGFTGATAVTINNGAVASYTVDSDTRITATVAASNSTGLIRVTSPAGTGVSSTNFVVGPSVTSVNIITANGTYRAGQQLQFNVVFSQPVTVSTTGGTPSLDVTVGGTVRQATYTGTASNTAAFRYTIVADDLDMDGVTLGGSIDLNEGTIRNSGGADADLDLTNVGATTGLLVDAVAPTVVISSTAGASGGITGTSPIPLTITFSESVTSFTVADVVVTGGNKGTFTGSGSTYNLNVTPTGGTVTVNIAASAARDAALNDNVAAPQFTITYVPLPTIGGLSAGAELPGMPVTITGTNFTSGSTVTFGGVAAGSVVFNSATSLTATVPAGASVGSSAVVVTTNGVSSSSSPAFAVLKVYDAVASCLSTVSYTTVGDGNWHYLLAGNGQVVAALQDTRVGLGTVSVQFLITGTANAVRQDARARKYLDRNWRLTATNPTFTGSAVNIRFYGLTSEFTRLQAADPAVTYANLKSTQYSGPNEDCSLDNNNNAIGQSRTLGLSASTPGNGVAWFVAQATVPDHFSEFYLTGSSIPLPVELTAFTAATEGSAVRLAWRTATEKNSARFEIERSLDGKAFARIGEVAAQGSKTSVTDYVFRDNQAPVSPALVYYRLRQVDLDGTFSYSSVRVVTIAAKTGLTLYPNPARSAVAVTGLAAGTAVDVLDTLGRTVVRATAGADGTAAITLAPGLPTGVYVVRSGPQTCRLTVE